MVAVCAVGALLFRFLMTLPGWQRYLGSGHCLFAACVMAMPLLLAGRGFQRCDQVRFAGAYAALCVAVFLLGSCAVVAWHTVGEVRSYGYSLAAVLVAIPASLCAVRTFRASAIASLLIVLLALPTIGLSQAALLWRLYALKAEVAAIAKHLESKRQTRGAYPTNLSGYQFIRADFRSLMTYWPPESLDGDHYVLAVDLFEGDGMGREYSPRSGWWYYPD